MSSIFLYNGNILTMDEKKLDCECVLINNNVIEFVGKYEEGLKYLDNDTIKIDLLGRTLLPGFNDSHMHLISYGLSKYKIDLTKIKSIEELQKSLSEFNASNNDIFNGWVLGHGWNHENFSDKRLPTKEDIDKIIKDKPVYLSRACYHIGVLNSKALELLGINKDTVNPEGGKIDKDLLTNEPTGIIRESALFMVSEKINISPKKDVLKQIIKGGIEDANKCGITSIQTDDFSHTSNFKLVLDTYNELNELKELNARINIQMLLENKEKLNEFLKLGLKTKNGNEWVKIGPLKLLGDGSLGSRTAALVDDYSDEHGNNGILIYNDNDIEELLEIAHKNDLQLAVHAIGDRAMLQVLDIYEKLKNKYNKKDPRFRIIHCQIGSDYIFDKFKELDVIADIQPVFIITDMHIADKRVGQSRIKNSYAWNTMLNKGIRLSGSSDAPIESFAPLLGIYSAVARKDINCFPEGGWYKEESIDLISAIKLFTKNAAYSTFEDNIKGSIKKGMLADLIILSKNITEVESDKIKDILVDVTIVNGKIVYKRK